MRDKCTCVYWDPFGYACSCNPDLWWQFQRRAVRPPVHLQWQDFLLLHDGRTAGWTPLVQHNFQLWARPEIFFLYRPYWWVSQGKTQQWGNPISGSVYIGWQAGRSRLHVRSTTFVSSGPKRHGTSFRVKDPPKFPSHLGKWHQGKSPPVHLFLTHWDHYVIKDAYMRKSVGTPTGLKMTQEAGLHALAFVLAKTMTYSKRPFNLFGWKNESKKWI